MSAENYDDEEVVVLKGVVEPELPGMPERGRDDEGSPYSTAVDVINEALETVAKRIDFLVTSRADINAEIKVLRDEHDRLGRMKKIAEGK